MALTPDSVLFSPRLMSWWESFRSTSFADGAGTAGAGDLALTPVAQGASDPLPCPARTLGCLSNLPRSERHRLHDALVKILRLGGVIISKAIRYSIFLTLPAGRN